MILLRYTFIEKSLSYIRLIRYSLGYKICLIIQRNNSHYTLFDLENTLMFQNDVSSKFNNFDITIAQMHLFWSYAAIHFIFDIDSCNFDIDRGINILLLQVKVMFFTLFMASNVTRYHPSSNPCLWFELY